MNVILKIEKTLKKQYFFPSLIALVLSTLFIGYALSSIALGILVFFSLWYAVVNRKKINMEYALLLPVLIYGLFVLSLFWTVNIDLTRRGLERTAVLLLVPLIFLFLPKFNLNQTKLVLEYFTKANFLYGVFFLIVGAINYFTTRSFSVFTYHELVSIFDLNAIYVSLIFSISLFYLLSKTDKTKIEKASILFFCVLLLLLSSKTMMLVLIIGTLLYIFYRKRNWFSKFKLISVIVLTALIIGVSSLPIKERFLTEKSTKFNEVLNNEKFVFVYPWTGTSIRLLQLRILKDQLEEENIFWKGFGLFASRENIKKKQIELNIWEGFHKKNYHNQYAQILSETGIIGLILLLLILIVNFRNALKSKNFLFLMFSILIPIVFFTESFLWRQRGLFLFIILYCLLNRTNFNRQSKRIDV